MITIFLSYAHTDQEFVNRLWADLTNLGYDVIQDTKTFEPGFDITYEIKSKLERSDFVIPVLTPNSLQSAWVTGVEVRVARQLQSRDHQLRVIPVLLARTDSHLQQLRNVLYVDFTDTDKYALSLARLVRGMPEVEYDELYNLRQELRSRSFEGASLLTLLKRAAKKSASSWKYSSAEDLIDAIEPSLYYWETLDAVYWWLLVYGILRFTEIDTWWDEDEWYEDSIEHAEIAPRGVALLNVLRNEPVR